jgi:hypothetical protein
MRDTRAFRVPLDRAHEKMSSGALEKKMAISLLARISCGVEDFDREGIAFSQHAFLKLPRSFGHFHPVSFLGRELERELAFRTGTHFTNTSVRTSVN